MTCNIRTSNGKLIGLDETVYKNTPPAKSDFKYSIEVEFNKEPQNIIEEIRNVFGVIGNKLKKKGQ